MENQKNTIVQAIENATGAEAVKAEAPKTEAPKKTKAPKVAKVTGKFDADEYATTFGDSYSPKEQERAAFSSVTETEAPAVSKSDVPAEKVQSFIRGLHIEQAYTGGKDFDRILSVMTYKTIMKAYCEKAPEYVSALLVAIENRVSDYAVKAVRTYIQKGALMVLKGNSVASFKPSLQREVATYLKGTTVLTFKPAKQVKELQAADTAYKPAMDAIDGAIKKATANVKKAVDGLNTEGGKALMNALQSELRFAEQVKKAAELLRTIEVSGGSIEAAITMLQNSTPAAPRKKNGAKLPVGNKPAESK